MKNSFIACFFYICALLFQSSLAFGQWSGKYGNEWISYESKYVKIDVTEAGLYKIPLSRLPAGLLQDPSTLQMWHRGVEVPLVRADEQEIWFYAEANEGASDSLLFRPTSARMNPYQSFFSDQGVYFLTNGTRPKRAVTVEKIPFSGQAETYHLHTDVVSLRDQFSLATLTPIPLILNNSYYENLNSWTGPSVYGDSAVGHTAANIVSFNKFSFRNYQLGTGISPVLNIMLNGLHFGRHEVQISVGKTDKSSDLSELTKASFTGLGGVKKEGLVLNDSQFSTEDGGVIGLRSKTSDIYDWFSLTYYTVTYPQKVKMEVDKPSYFTFLPSLATVSRVSVETVSDKPVVLDISNPYEPKLLEGVQSGNRFEMMVPRTDGKKLNLLSTSTDLIKVVAPGKLSLIDFNPLFASSSLGAVSNNASPAAYDYLIITSDTLKQGAIEYAKYRSSVEGGSFNTIVYDAKTLYNQFNYGEPSPIGVKRFVDFMLKSGIRSDHNLLLVGLGISAPDAAGLRLKKDFPQDVPTFGDPGSDVLLVTGIHGLGQDTPAIPVGRISAQNQQQVLNYLNKVKEFEADKLDRGWQKKVLHLNGGKTSSEINQLSTALRNLDPLVEGSVFGGEVKAFVKQTTIETERVDISKDVNDGVGMISYFGHGSFSITDLDMGKVSDASRNYNNPGKYPLMYFNGCGVGNIYSGRSVLALSTDWLLTPKVGAIAVIANSFNSYISPSSKQLKTLYEELFVKSTSASTIGQIMQNVVKRMLSSSPDAYDITNIHQSNLQGDPAIRLFSFPNPDYTFSNDKPVIIVGELKKTIGASNRLRVGMVMANSGKFIKGQSVPLQTTYTYKNGQTNTKLEHFESFALVDTVFFDIPSDSRVISRIEVNIDPLNTIVESSKVNNSAELNIDWDVANKLEVYPERGTKDVVAPSLVVTMNGRSVQNEEHLFSDPTINVRLTDDNSLVADPALFELYIRPCWGDGCNYEKIEINASGIQAISDRTLLLNTVLKDLKSGSYEVLANGKDKAGNSSSSSYNIRFAIEEISNTQINLVASPNPASEFIRFDTNAGDTVESMNYTIYNLSGKVIGYSNEKIEYPGKQTWYWFRKENPAGLYLYKVEVLGKDKAPVIIKGKIVLQ